MAKIMFIDTETGGLYPKHSLLQVAFILYDTEQMKFIDKFVSYVRPMDGDLPIEAGALKTNGILMDDIPTFPESVDVQRDICEVLSRHVDKYDTKSKFFFCAYNAGFDADMMWAWWSRCNKLTGDSKNYFGSYVYKRPLIDVMVLAGQHLMDELPNMKNFKMVTVGKTLGIDFDEDSLHDALEDIKLMIRVYSKIGGFK